MSADKSKFMDLTSLLAPAGKSSWAEESEQESMEKPAAAAPKKAWGAPVPSGPAAKSSEKSWPSLENAATAPAKKDEPAPRSAPRETRGGDRGYGDDRRGGYAEDRRGGYGRERYGNDREYNDERRGGYGDDRRGGYGDDRRGGYGEDRRGGYGDDRRGGYGEDRPRREERAREAVPLPDSPPFTAYVGNLPYEADDRMIEELFEGLGVKDVRIVMDRETRKSKGYGYVEFEDQESLKKAVELSGKEFEGRSLKIDVAEQKRPQERRDDRGGNRRGGDSFFGKDRFNNPEPREVRERPRLNLQPRTLPQEPAGEQQAKKPKEDPFGGAAPKPVKDPFAQTEKRESPKEPVVKQEEKPRREAPRAEPKPDDSRAAQSSSWRRQAGDETKLPAQRSGMGAAPRGNERRPAAGPDSDGWQQQDGGRRAPRQESQRRPQQSKEGDASNARDTSQGNTFNALAESDA